MNKGKAMIFKKIRRMFMEPCHKCAWSNYSFCYRPEVLDFYSKLDGKEYYSVSCGLCRGTWHCHFKKKENEDD